MPKLFCVLKQSRAFSNQGYQGPSLGRAGIQLDLAEVDSLSEAQDCAERLLAVNPVGWVVVSSQTGKVIYTAKGGVT